MRRRDFLGLLGGAALAPFGVSPGSAAAPTSLGAPVARDDGWPVASLDDDHLIDRVALREMTDRLAASPKANVHALLVARRGKLAFERYFTGSDEIYGQRLNNVAFDADTMNDMKSVSKSVASLAVGAAIDRGLIKSVDQPIFSFFPELADLRTPEKDRLLLSHALTMTMGLEWIEATPDNDDDNDESRMHMSADPARYVLALPSAVPPGWEFFYNTGALTLASAIVHRTTGQYLDEFAKTALFEPLGVARFQWKRVKGDTDAGGGLRLRPRDMAKIGQLVLSGGRWNDRQIVSKDWIEASTSPKIESTISQFYGYLWWLGRSLLEGGEIQWIMAAGRGGQSIRVVPELDLVVAITAGYYQDYSPGASQLRENLFRGVLRAASRAG